MSTTLDEYLEEVDRWKEAALKRRLSVPSSARSSLDREARSWLEAKLGRLLETETDARPIEAELAHLDEENDALRAECEKLRKE